MAQISGNSCNIITINPMETECVVVNASTPSSTNGSVQVLINGGTPPYSIVWNNGQQGSTLTGLAPGTYSATVTDHYEDYVITTQCVVGSDTAVVQQFDGCNDYAGVTIYVVGANVNPNKPIIKFNEIDGCYEYVGEVTLSSGYSALTVSNSYGNCNFCNPPSPTPIVQPTICLSNGVDLQYEFTPNGTDSNGNFQWENTQYNMTITYNALVRNSYWQVNNWVGSGTMKKNEMPPSTVPTGTWTNYGVSSELVWTLTIGECQGFPLNLTSSVSDPECLGQDGGVVLVGAGGTPPYQYSLPGYMNTLQTSGVFNNLPSGNYTASVQDNSSGTATTTFTIGTGTNSVNYVLVLTWTNNADVNDTFNNSLTKSYNYSFYTVPALPSGVSLTFDLKLSHSREKGGQLITGGSVMFTHTFTALKNSTSLTISDGSPTNSFATPCADRIATVSSFDSTSNNITITSSDTVTGSVSQTVILASIGYDCDCPTYGDYDTVLQATNVRINGSLCSTVTTYSNIKPLEVILSGCNPAT